MRKKRKEVKTKLAGIYKEFVFDDTSGWQATGRFRSTGIFLNSSGAKEKKSKMCLSLQEAKNFRTVGAKPVEAKPEKTNSKKTYLLEDLINDWKRINYAQIELSSKETYEKLLSFFDGLTFKVDIGLESERKILLLKQDVEEIDVEMVDSLILTLMSSDFPKSSRRESFKKEIKLLGQIFKFYQTRKNPTFIVPVLSIHLKKCVIKKKAKNANKEKSLRVEDLPKFFNELSNHSNQQYYYLALCQFFLALRIGEACGLHWEGFDEGEKEWKIDKTVVWADSDQKGIIKNLPKNDSIRYQPFSEFFLSEMKFCQRLFRRNSGLVFQRKGGKPLRRNSVVRAYNVALEKCGITYTSGSHFMRKTSATMGLSVTKDIRGMSDFLGHGSIKESDAYISRHESKEIHAEALDAVFKKAVGGENSGGLQLVK